MRKLQTIIVGTIMAAGVITFGTGLATRNKTASYIGAGVFLEGTAGLIMIKKPEEDCSNRNGSVYRN